MIKRITTHIAVCVIISVCATIGKETQECNFEKECAMGNISQEICERRRCCYHVRPDSSVTCYMKNFQPETTTDKTRAFTEKYPDDAIYLSQEMRNKLLSTQNLTKVQAIKLINKYEDSIKDFTMRSEINWVYNFRQLITTHVRVTTNTLLEPLHFGSGTSIQLQQGWGITKNGTAKNITATVVTEYPELINIFIKEQEGQCGGKDKIYMDDTPIISVKAYDSEWNVLSVPVSYTATGVNTTMFKHEENISLSCTFLKEDKKNHDWFTDGCTLLSYTNSTISCFCNHTTKFSMLFVIAPFNFQLSSTHKNYISILEYCMESLSLFCLIVTFFILTLVQRRRSKGSSVSGMRAGERTVVHANFVVSLSLLHFTRLFSEIATWNHVSCTMIAVLSHYLMISSGMWMLIEGVLLYLNVIVRSMKNTALGIHKYWTGWGIPAVVVIISAAIGLSSNSYIGWDEKNTERCIDGEVRYSAIAPTVRLHEAYCWLTYEKNMIWSAAGPLIIIFSFNIFILAHTVVFIWRLNRKTGSMMPANYNNDSRQFWKTAKSIFVLFPILGVPWLIGFLINTQSQTINLVFQYIHVVLNGLQGFFIFLLYCVVNRESRGIVSRVASSRWEQHKISMSASNTFGRSTSGSRRKGQRKSVSSQMGGSEQNMNMTRMGSQYSVYTSSMNRKQSSGSASTSLSGCAQRISRIMPTNAIDGNGHRQKPGYMSGCSSSLPRMDQQESRIFLKRSGTISVISSIDHEIRRRYSIDRYICKACKGGPCIHAINNVAGLADKPRHNTEPVLIGYKRTSSLENIDTATASTHEIYQQNRWPRRMTAEEFKRFSAIPEEKRRSGINSIISVGSNEHLSSRLPGHSSLNHEDIEMKAMKKQSLVVDVVVEEVDANSKEDISEFASSGKSNVPSLQNHAKSDESNFGDKKPYTDKQNTTEQNGKGQFSAAQTMNGIAN